MSAKKKYVSLSKKQKEQLRNEADRRQREQGDTSGRALAAWAKQSFELAATPGSTTIRRIIREKERSEPADGRVSKPVRDKTGMCDALERQLYNWVCHQYNQRRNINGALICAQANRIQSLLNQRSDGNVHKLSFSEGWLSNFKRR